MRGASGRQRAREGRFAALAMAGVLLLAGSIVPPAHPEAAVAAGERTRYEIEATIDAGLGAITADLFLDWVNTIGATQKNLPFRLYPNAAYYGNGALSVLEATAAGVAVEPEIAADPTVMELPLPEPVAPGERIAVAMRFRTTVPTGAADPIGILQRDARDVWALADWYPIVAGFEPGEGWYLEPPTSFGDPTLSESADYRVRVDAPATYTVLGTGMERTAAPVAGTARTMLDAPGAREFAMTLLPGAVGEEIAVSRGTAGDTGLAVALPSVLLVPGLEELLVETATAALPVYEAWLGAYPGGNVDLTTADLGGAIAVAWAGLIWLDLAPFAADGELSEPERARLRFIVVHEIGHQWIGNLVGANTNDHQFMGEGLVNAVAVAVFREMDGAETAGRYLRADVAGAYLALLRDGRDGIANTPISDDRDGARHAIIVYGKAAVGFEAIRQAIGNDAFVAAIAAYAETFRFGLAGPEDLLATFEMAAGKDLDALWSFWFERAEATVADVEAVLDGYAGG